MKSVLFHPERLQQDDDPSLSHFFGGGGYPVYLHEMVFHADEYLDRVEQLVSSIDSYGRFLSAEEQQQLSGSGSLELLQQVLARSCVYGGQWRNASVIGNRYTFY